VYGVSITIGGSIRFLRESTGVATESTGIVIELTGIATEIKRKCRIAWKTFVRKFMMVHFLSLFSTRE
jgi:hypothetical protein